LLVLLIELLVKGRPGGSGAASRRREKQIKEARKQGFVDECIELDPILAR
jgi:hypothetical protein